jgi:hypothetical protein
MPLPQPTSFTELMRFQHVAAVNISGAGKSCWSGRLGDTSTVEAEAGWVVLGIAPEDNSLLYHKDLVLRPLQDMFEHQGQELDERTLLRYRHALAIVLHENTHLLAPAGADVAKSHALMRASSAVNAYTEAVKEAYSHGNLDRYILELQLDKVAPGIENVVTAAKYPNYTPAGQAMAHGLGRLSGLGSDEVLRRLAVVTPSALWAETATMTFRSNDLHHLLSGRDASVARFEIESAMKRQFARLEDIKEGPLISLRGKSFAVGRQAFKAGEAVCDRIRQQYGVPAGKALSGVAPLRTAQAPASGDRAERGEAERRAAGLHTRRQNPAER